MSAETRDRVLRVAAEDFGGVSADEAVQRLLDEHWRTQCIAAMERVKAEEPDSWAEYLAEGKEWDGSQPPIMEPRGAGETA